MGNHYSDLVFDEIREEDKALLKRVKKAHIKANMGFLIIFSIGFTACTYFFTAFLIAPSDSLIIKLLSLIILGAGMFGCGMLVYEIIAGIKGIRKGVVLTASREMENRDGRNSSYQFLPVYFRYLHGRQRRISHEFFRKS